MHGVQIILSALGIFFCFLILSHIPLFKTKKIFHDGFSIDKNITANFRFTRLEPSTVVYSCFIHYSVCVVSIPGYIIVGSCKKKKMSSNDDRVQQNRYKSVTDKWKKKKSIEFILKL